MRKVFYILTLLLASSTFLFAQKLLDAVEAKNYEAAEKYIRAGADVNKANDDGQFPLWKAIWNQDAKMVALLIKNGADAEKKFKGPKSKITCLEIVAQEGGLEMARLLVDAGAKVDERNAVGHTPLRIASRNGHLDLVQYFLSKGGAIDSKGDDGATPLEHAASKGHLEIVTFLVEKGANINIQDNEKDFALGEAAKAGFFDVVNYLLSKRADTSLKNQDGYTAEDLAKISGQKKIAELLKQKAVN